MELITIKTLNSALERTMNRELYDLDITFTQATVLFYLVKNQHRDVVHRDLIEHLGLTNPTISLILKAMEAKGLITSGTPSYNRKSKTILLTDKALGMADEVSARYKKAKRKLFKGVSTEQKKLMLSTMETILENCSSADYRKGSR